MNKHLRNMEFNPLPSFTAMPSKFRSMVIVCLLALLTTGMAVASDRGASFRLSQANASVTVSKTDVLVAESFRLTLTVVAPHGAKVSLPLIGDQLGEFEVLDIQDVAGIPADASPGQRIWTRRMRLESIATGDLQIPALEIKIADGAESRTLTTKPVSVCVLSVIEGRSDPSQFRDIQSVVDVQIPQQKNNSWVVWTFGGLGIMALCVAAVAVVVGRKAWLTPAQWATRELEALRDSEAMGFRDTETVAAELSSVLRDFLELQFEITAPVQTSGELLAAVENGKYVNAELAGRLGDLFAIAEQSKFAGLKLPGTQLNKAIDQAVSVVNEAGRYNSETSSKDSQGGVSLAVATGNETTRKQEAN